MHGKNHSRSSTKGGKGKSGGGTVLVKKTVARQTTSIDENIMALRAAIFDTDGSDKDVTAAIAPSLMKYNKNGLDLSIEFSTRLDREEVEWAFDLCQENMEEKYDASGYGWDDEDKKKELTEKGTRFLLVREWPADDEEKGELVGFVHFRFTVQGEVIDQMAGEPSLHIFDIHIEEHSQRKGLGKHLLTLLELVARREGMRVLSLPVMLDDAETEAWLAATKRGFAKDASMTKLGFDAQMEGFEMFSKSFPVKPAGAGAAKSTSAADAQLAAQVALKIAAQKAAPAPTAAAVQSKLGTGGADTPVGAGAANAVPKPPASTDATAPAAVAPPVAPTTEGAAQTDESREKPTHSK